MSDTAKIEAHFQSLNIPRPGELGGQSWKLANLSGVTVLFGKNGSGKSKLLRAIRDEKQQYSHYVVPERAGEIDYQAHHLEGQMDAQHRHDNSRHNFSGDYRRQVIARIQAYFAVRGDYRGDTVPTKPDELEAFITPLLPDFTLALRGVGVPPYQLQRITNSQPITNMSLLSSGETQIFTLAIDVMTIAGIWDIQNAQSRLLLIDEPDAHIHPDLQVRFADFLVQVAKRFNIQLIIATHSTTLLAALGQFAKDCASVMYIDRVKLDFKAEPFTDLLRELSACLGGHALMGPLFGSPILLVEGDDDYRIWSQVPRYHHTDFSVIPCDGEQIKKYQRSLEKILAALREGSDKPAGYALIDKDKGKPIASESAPQHHIRYIQLACHESENLYLADEVLAALGHDWQSAQALIIAQASKFGQKESKLASAASWDRMTADIKDVIEQIAQILDTKHVHWTLRVAKALGDEKPGSSIATFLGAEVIQALWGVA